MNGDGDSLKEFYDSSDIDNDLKADINSLENLKKNKYWDDDEDLDITDDELPHLLSQDEII